MRTKERNSYEKYIGQNINNFTIILILPQERGGIGVKFKCTCACGKILSVRASSVIKGKNKSCGCLKVSNLTGKRKDGLHFPIVESICG